MYALSRLFAAVLHVDSFCYGSVRSAEGYDGFVAVDGLVDGRPAIWRGEMTPMTDLRCQDFEFLVRSFL